MDADTIFNHMAGPESGVGVAGSSFTHYAYPGIYQNQVSVRALSSPPDLRYLPGLPPLRPYTKRRYRRLGQSCGSTNLPIGWSCRVRIVVLRMFWMKNISSRWQPRDECKLRTTTACAVRQRSAFVRCRRLPVRRCEEWAITSPWQAVSNVAIDIDASELAIIVGLLHGKPYITQEVIWGAGQPVQPSEYVGIGLSSVAHSSMSCWLTFCMVVGDVQEYTFRN